MIEVQQVEIRAGEFSVSNVSFQILAGEYAVLMGRTGIGKTTILEAICGLRKIAAGIIRIGGQDVTRLLPGDRRVGYVPQDLALFPTLSVRQHLEFAPRLQRMPKQDMAHCVDGLASQLGITSLMQRSVRDLSGGEAQRVAIGRALAMQPAVLLLDEPLSALDQQTRRDTAQMLEQLKRDKVTVLHVTHNEEEAELLGDRRLVMQDGTILELSQGSA